MPCQDFAGPPPGAILAVSGLASMSQPQLVHPTADSDELEASDAAGLAVGPPTVYAGFLIGADSKVTPEAACIARTKLEGVQECVAGIP